MLLSSHDSWAPARHLPQPGFQRYFSSSSYRLKSGGIFRGTSVPASIKFPNYSGISKVSCSAAVIAPHHIPWPVSVTSSSSSMSHETCQLGRLQCHHSQQTEDASTLSLNLKGKVPAWKLKWHLPFMQERQKAQEPKLGRGTGLLAVYSLR